MHPHIIEGSTVLDIRSDRVPLRTMLGVQQRVQHEGRRRRNRHGRAVSCRPASAAAASNRAGEKTGVRS